MSHHSAIEVRPFSLRVDIFERCGLARRKVGCNRFRRVYGFGVPRAACSILRINNGFIEYFSD